VSAYREEMFGGLLPPALEVMTAFTQPYDYGALEPHISGFRAHFTAARARKGAGSNNRR
jgi:hypothetical protein